MVVTVVITVIVAVLVTVLVTVLAGRPTERLARHGQVAHLRAGRRR